MVLFPPRSAFITGLSRVKDVPLLECLHLLRRRLITAALLDVKDKIVQLLKDDKRLAMGQRISVDKTIGNGCQSLAAHLRSFTSNTFALSRNILL